AQVFAQSSYEVILYDKDSASLQRAQEKMEILLQRAVDKERLTVEEKEETLQSLQFETVLDLVKDVDLVVEAIVENMEVKKTLFQELDKLTPAHTILATNTSSLSITEIASVTNRPEKVIGMHFMNPVPVMK